MDALSIRGLRAAVLGASLLSLGAGHRTPNFVINASTPELAAQVGRAAEDLRRDLAVEWVGQELPQWSQPCPITIVDGEHLGAGGATSFLFDRGEVFGWQMTIQGSRERILDSVLPHEITHTVFASHFRRPLPRWADEGACTTVEHHSERAKQQQMLVHFLKTDRGIPFSRMFAMTEYPADVMPLYSQGYSLSRFLIEQRGKPAFMAYLADGMEQGNWHAVTRRHYGYNNLASLQESWLEWVRQGSPRIEATDPALAAREATITLASATSSTSAVPEAVKASPPARPRPSAIYRAAGEGRQSPPSNAQTAAAVAPRRDDGWRPARSSRGDADSSKAAATAAAGAMASSTPAAADADFTNAQSRSPMRAEPLRTDVTRPQEPQRPRHTILEWSRAGGSHAAP